ncbi:MAG TPA: sugar transferase [Candidatus Limiplasma sp.]|nr:sugar transferase [Candidatus Limiplasma sp.]HRX08663.1 sugar transferase [Candidatus Limiplasma sp.]
MKKRTFQSQLLTTAFQALLYLCVFAAFFLMQSIGNAQLLNYSRTAAVTMATFTIMMFLLANVYGGFQMGERKTRSVFFAILISVILTDIVTYLQLQIMNVNPAKNPRLILFGMDFVWFLITLVVQTAIIYVIVRLGDVMYYKLNPPQRCCIIAANQELADHVAQKIATFPKRYTLCDVLHYHCDDLRETILEHEVVFITGIPDTEEAAIEAFCYQHGKSMFLAAELEDVIISSSTQVVIDDTLFLHTFQVEPTPVQRAVKRLMDIVFSAIGIVILSPVMLVTAILIKIYDKGPVFFKQKRATLNGKVFTIIKFRTMFDHDTTKTGQPTAKNDTRITKIGFILRRLRIDELPQLFNIFVGDMSIVGPRPEMLENVDRYTRDVPEFVYRQKMKAGMTGLAQVDGKYNTSPKDKIILDLMYIHRFSLMTDIRLMLRTVTVLFRPDSNEGFHTAKKANKLPIRIRPKTRPTKTQ